MAYPTLNTIEQTRDAIQTFGGYNHNNSVGDGEFYDMLNMTSDGYPILQQRKSRGQYAAPGSVQGLLSKDNLCYVDGTKLVINSSPVEMYLSTASEECPKTLVSMGAYILVFPDKKYINTENYTDIGSIEATKETTGTVSFSLCRIDGSAYQDISTEEIKEPANGDLWMDSSSGTAILKQYDAGTAMWVEIATTYVKIAATGIGAAFAQYDGVTISGITIDSEIELNGSQVIWERGDDYIVITGMIPSAQTQTTAVTVSRKMPAMDFIIEANNRLWGCRYGLSNSGKAVNEIYACKQGDFKNWNCFMGISTDSYAASVGTDGQFTGAITHLGYPLFFKETNLHKVYGTIPSNFQIQTTACKGVERGSSKSLAIVNSTLFYKGETGICVYDGSTPKELTAALGNVRYHNAIGACLGNKYYIDMADAEGTYNLFAYDTDTNTLHKEDYLQVDEFCYCHGELYYVDHADGKIKTINGSGVLVEEEIPWMVETGKIGMYTPDNKYLSRMNIRLSMEIGSTLIGEIEYDSKGKWQRLFRLYGKNSSTFTMPIRPKRCDHFKLRLSGTGNVKIYSIIKTMEKGSDV